MGALHCGPCLHVVGSLMEEAEKRGWGRKKQPFACGIPLFAFRSTWKSFSAPARIIVFFFERAPDEKDRGNKDITEWKGAPSPHTIRDCRAGRRCVRNERYIPHKFFFFCSEFMVGGDRIFCSLSHKRKLGLCGARKEMDFGLFPAVFVGRPWSYLFCVKGAVKGSWPGVCAWRGDSG